MEAAGLLQGSEVQRLVLRAPEKAIEALDLALAKDDSRTDELGFFAGILCTEALDLDGFAPECLVTSFSFEVVFTFA